MEFIEVFMSIFNKTWAIIQSIDLFGVPLGTLLICLLILIFIVRIFFAREED